MQDSEKRINEKKYELDGLLEKNCLSFVDKVWASRAFTSYLFVTLDISI